MLGKRRVAVYPFKGKVVIAGVGDVATGKYPERLCLQSALDSAREAILSSGINKNDIDVVMPCGTFFNRRYNTDMVFSQMVEELGLLRKANSNVQVFSGGSSGLNMLKSACGLVSAGLAKVVLCVQSDKVGSASLQEMIDLFAIFGIPEEWESPYGFFMAATGALPATRYMYETGVTHEQLASVVVSMRKWAALNPKAMLTRQLTVDEILEAKLCTTNLTTKEGNVLADGGSAFIVTSAQKAKEAGAKPVYPLGFGSRVQHYSISQDTDLTRLGFVEAARDAYGMAKIKPEDIDIAEFYDGYPVYPLIALEGLGICNRGEAGAFVYEGNTWPGGKLPMTTNGGMLALGHTAGGGGMEVLVEACRQLRGEAEQRQVKNAKIAAVTGLGGSFMDSQVAILGTEVP
jgi:acetyl-CoA C-acetyltransferase